MLEWYQKIELLKYKYIKLSKRTYIVIFPISHSIETVEDMIKMGVYVNDLNLHDSSRELILAGTQQSAELQLALDQVNIQIKSTIPTKQCFD